MASDIDRGRAHAPFDRAKQPDGLLDQWHVDLMEFAQKSADLLRDVLIANLRGE